MSAFGLLIVVVTPVNGNPVYVGYASGRNKVRFKVECV